MAVFRIEKTRDYTVMANHHLKNRSLSLKAKGLLSLMLSLPDNWDYTLAGLASICRDGVDGIRATVKELEAQGYVNRRRIRNEKGQLTTAEYIIYEKPQSAEKAKLSPIQQNPIQGNPAEENPALEKAIQLKTHTLNTKEVNTQSINITRAREIREMIQCNLGYDALCKQFDKKRIDQVIEMLIETVFLAEHAETVTIGKVAYSSDLALKRLMELNNSHIEYVFECMEKQKGAISNIRQYWLTALFQAPLTIDAYYEAEVRNGS